LGLAAARVLGLPARPYRPRTPDCLVCAFDLNEVSAIDALSHRAQIRSAASSDLLGLAAARVLGLPARPYRPRTPDCLVCAFDLNEVSAIDALSHRAQIRRDT